MAAGRVHSVLATEETADGSGSEGEEGEEGVLTTCFRRVCGGAAGACGPAPAGRRLPLRAWRAYIRRARCLRGHRPLPRLPANSWGAAQNGRLGSGLGEDANCPELVPDVDGERILGLACGLDHTLVLVDSL